MSVVAELVLLSLLVLMSGIAGVSGFVFAKSIEEENSGSARVWGMVFAVASLIAALVFGGLV